MRTTSLKLKPCGWLHSNSSAIPVLAVVIGKFRALNKNENLLLRSLNIESLSFQWIVQADRWMMLKVCTQEPTFLFTNTFSREFDVLQSYANTCIFNQVQRSMILSWTQPRTRLHRSSGYPQADSNVTNQMNRSAATWKNAPSRLA
jgi:hypothetical protein